MLIELGGAVVVLKGEANPIVVAAIEALRANGGCFAEQAPAPPADILLVSCTLLPGAAEAGSQALVRETRAAAKAMAERRAGRIVFMLSALAGMPMRRHPDYSIEAAAVFAGMRTLAMEFGPRILVNAVGVGAIGADTLVSGDRSMLSHTPVGRIGTIAEAVAAVLFFCDPLNTYTTGQMLAVDGGWTAGYGRNF
jgi:NAD(P)-dependent dehydrogenase (short-subunit alcohol dehydrogenase family)